VNGPGRATQAVGDFLQVHHLSVAHLEAEAEEFAGAIRALQARHPMDLS
jgi:hypothetical protein